MQSRAFVSVGQDRILSAVRFTTKLNESRHSKKAILHLERYVEKNSLVVDGSKFSSVSLFTSVDRILRMNTV